MEFGPRALGNRSILGDPRRRDMQETLNLKIKFRESFRPFAPAVLEERAADCFDLKETSAYMLLVAPVREELRVNGENERAAGMMARLKERRSTLPAITHVDYSARVQTVSVVDNSRFHSLLSAFERRTGCPVLVNTSFNIRGEPPVCTPEDAYRCFMKTEMDYLVLGNCLLDKTSRREAFQTADPKTTAIGKSPLLAASSPKHDLSVAALRRFGFTLGAMFLVFGAILSWRHRLAGRPLSSFGFLFLVISIFGPPWLRFVYRPWMFLARILGTITSTILLTFVFFLVLTPLGFLQRLFGKGPLDLRFKSGETTYWQTRAGHPASADYEKQF
jgi:hypothetical protein